MSFLLFSIYVCPLETFQQSTSGPQAIKPTFTERPVIRQSEEGAKIIFECRLVGEPKPQVTWYHNDKVVDASKDKRYNITMEHDAKLYYLCR